MRSRSRRLRCLVVLPFLLAIVCPIGCGPSRVPDGGQINATIPADQAAKQNDAYKNYSKTRKGKPPG